LVPSAAKKRCFGNRIAEYLLLNSVRDLLYDRIINVFGVDAQCGAVSGETDEDDAPLFRGYEFKKLIPD
jgi:hypothetical protein